MYRADWGQSVRTEHHLATPNGSRGGASMSDIELPGVWVFVADLLLPVSRGDALGEQLRDTHADAAS
jgi:hypothetical protein